MEVFVQLVFGHFIGDFFFQTRVMAENKYHPDILGYIWCTVHVLVYTVVVAVCAGEFSPVFLIGIALPHWIVDKWSLAFVWMRLLGRGGLMKSQDPQQVAFGVVIYVVMDQTIHLVSLYLLTKLL